MSAEKWGIKLKKNILSSTNHNTPEWLRDAKFGIYTHWGIYSVHGTVPNTTWYSHFLYDGREREVEHHIKTYGELQKFGYTDFIPMFTGEKFDADEWAECFKNAGAKFAGPVGEHHDGFSMWKTDLNKFNSFNMGPKRDVVAELEKAIRGHDMRFMVALHHAENYWFLSRVKGTDSMKPEFETIFSKVGIWSKEKFAKFWLDKTIEVIDKFSPDMLWFDFGLKEIPDIYKQKILKYYYNKGDVALTYKNRDLMVGSGTIDLELGRYNDVQHNNWITDTTIDAGEAWGYMNNAKYKTPISLIHYLIDNVAKNGMLLLNVGPKADGTLPEEAKHILYKMGKWLKLNGEAIYGTTPWYASIEGPTKMEKNGGFTESEELNYTTEDIRYTAKDNYIYATILARPKNEVTLKSVSFYLLETEIECIELLGIDKKLNFKVCGEKIKVEIPYTNNLEYAFVLKITRKKIII